MQHRVKKTFFLCVLYLFTCQFTTVHAMLQGVVQVEKKWKAGYSHGYGEPIQNIETGPSYSGAPVTHGVPPNITKTSFYTRADVLTLANWLKTECIDKNYNAIYLCARSCGAGIAINCLYQLLHYNSNYFEGSKIKSQEDAQAILGAIKNGALEFTVPFLNLRKANALIIPSLIGGYGATFFIFFFAWYKMRIKLSIALLFSSLVGIYCLGSKISIAVSQPVSDNYIVPELTHHNYDPSHITPLAALAGLRGNIKCPVLIHFSKYDGVLQNTESDMVTMYDAFRKDNEKNTFFLYADDDSHIKRGVQHIGLRSQFTAMVYTGTNKIEERYQPTIEELRKIINPWQYRSYWKYPFYLKYKK